MMDKDFDWSGIPPKIREVLESRVGAAVPDVAAAPTQQEFNALLKSLRDAGIIAEK